MGTLQAETEEKQEMDDSGCIQDESLIAKGQVQLLDLSDDVLLLILKHLAPYDLKAVGYTCPRLGALVLDRSLWVTVDAREQPTGRVRLRWLLAHALHAGTKELYISGYAREVTHCRGHVAPSDDATVDNANDGEGNDASGQPPEVSGNAAQAPRVIEIPALGANARLYVNDEDDNPTEALTWAWPAAARADDACPGPQFTLSPLSLRRLHDTCRLTALALDYCNINCATTGINHFPPTLRKLSLIGSKCYNLSLDRSFLFKIQDYLPDLESLDVSECDWIEPATLLTLSKMPRLLHLSLRDCHRMTEFVAYASLATRYGFTNLESLDLRGSPVGDSEVSALGWLRALRTLRAAPARARRLPAPPARAADPPAHWETQEPEYYKIKTNVEFASKEKLQDGQDGSCSDQIDCGQSSSPSDAKSEDSLKRKAPSPNAGPSKRKRDNEDASSNNASPSNAGANNASSNNASPSNAGANNASSNNASPSSFQSNDQACTHNSEPRHNILYVNVRQQLHSVYRLSLFNQNPSQENPGNPRTVFLTHPSLHLDATSLVTDSAIRRFGRADGEDINVVNIGPNGPYIAPNTPGARPNRSSLRHLSITGFRHITDRSLVHLATAAPELVHLDLSETNVTPQGVENFKSLRPDCEVIFSPYVERKIEDE